MDTLKTQLSAMQQQLSQLATAQSAHGAALATLAAAAEHSGAPGAGDGAQQQLQQQLPVAQRPRLDDSASPLDKDIVLDTVLGFIGRGDYLYAGAVNRRWRGRYIKMCYKVRTQPQGLKLYTTLKSAVVTAARLQLALDSNLNIADLQKCSYRLGQLLVKHSFEARAVLTLAKCYGLEWSQHFTTIASRAQQLPLLQWLYN
eukprot:10084-Heterococcus_DN1.PRE.5